MDASIKERLQEIKRKQKAKEHAIREGLGEYSDEELALLLSGIEILYNDRVFGNLECLPWMRIAVYGLLWGRKGDESDSNTSAILILILMDVGMYRLCYFSILVIGLYVNMSCGLCS